MDLLSPSAGVITKVLERIKLAEAREKLQRSSEEATGVTLEGTGHGSYKEECPVYLVFENPNGMQCGVPSPCLASKFSLKVFGITISSSVPIRVSVEYLVPWNATAAAAVAVRRSMRRLETAPPWPTRKRTSRSTSRPGSL